MACLDIPLHGSSLALFENYVEELVEILRSKFQCGISVEGVNTVSPGRRFSETLPNGVVISVWKADLSTFQADAVVNAANINLRHSGGLALSLARAGGPSIQKECCEYIRKNGRLQTGDAVVTNAGQLRYKVIIHAAGPMVPNYCSTTELNKAETLLQKAIGSILDKVEEYHLDSVAIPAISSGIFNFPLHKCANTIVSSVKLYYESSRKHTHIPREILLTNIDEITVAEMHKACQRLLRPATPPSYSLVASGQSATEASAITVKFEHVSLHLVKDLIENLKTDVIVNFIWTKSKKDKPTISRDFLLKAGDDMAKEFNDKCKGKTLIHTKPGKLQCKEVFHIICSLQDKVEVVTEKVMDCFRMAVERKHKSISISAVAAAKAVYDEEETAKMIVKATECHAMKSRDTLEFHFVTRPETHNLFKAYENQMQALNQQSSNPNFSDAYGYSQRSASDPKVTLFGQFPEPIQEAKHWINQLCSTTGTQIICSNFVQHLGQDDCQSLSDLSRRYLSVEEHWVNGHSSVVIRGEPDKAAVAKVKVERLVCKVLNRFLEAEKNEIRQLTGQTVVARRTEVHRNEPAFSEKQSDFSRVGLEVVKMERVENDALGKLFKLKKKQLKISNGRVMFQCLPAHLCDVVCQIGFHVDCAPPHDPAYGEGIYFTGSLKEATWVWYRPDEKYQYFVEAEVLTGKTTQGSRSLILPPAVNGKPEVLYDSVHGDGDISVIFSGHQALPMYIFTCKTQSSDTGFYL